MSRCPAKGTSWHMLTLKAQTIMPIKDSDYTGCPVQSESSMGRQGSTFSSVGKLRLIKLSGCTSLYVHGNLYLTLDTSSHGNDVLNFQ